MVLMPIRDGAWTRSSQSTMVIFYCDILDPVPANPHHNRDPLRHHLKAEAYMREPGRHPATPSSSSALRWSSSSSTT